MVALLHFVEPGIENIEIYFRSWDDLMSYFVNTQWLDDNSFDLINFIIRNVSLFTSCIIIDHDYNSELHVNKLKLNKLRSSYYENHLTKHSQITIYIQGYPQL